MKNVNNQLVLSVIKFVILVKVNQNHVKNVQLTLIETKFQIVNVKKDIMTTEKTKSVHHVHINVKNVKRMLITVPNVNPEELINQNVNVKMALMMTENLAKHVPPNVKLVLLKTPVLNVLETGKIQVSVLVQKELMILVKKLVHLVMINVTLVLKTKINV